MRISFRFPAKDRRCIRDVIGFNDTWVIVLGIPVIGFIIPVFFFQESPLRDGWSYFSVIWFFSMVYTAVYWLAVRMIMIWKRRRFPLQEETMKRIMSTLLFIIPFYLVFTLVMDKVKELAGAPGLVHVPDWQHKAASILMIILVSSLYESVYLYNRWKESLVEQERLKRVFVESQLEGLKNQVNPHFLFNSLNTLMYLIPEDTDRAVMFVQKLAKVYRYVLEIQDVQLVSLEEELKFMESFAYLLKERFGAAFEMHIGLSESARRMMVVPLSLQILVENAVKHNVVTTTQPLHVWIEEKDGDLQVRNNLQTKNAVENSTKLGLMNIRKRFAFFSDRPLEVLQTEQEFCVLLPLIQGGLQAEKGLYPGGVEMQ